ncbi:glycosyltransferase family 2 protein [Candidatus Parcubacteria bacterium]|nr:MAG: glycosyltransferase family 2 protein [Candidatus Parcubacteria bacterium]
MKAVVILPTYQEKGNVERVIPILQDKIFPKIANYEMSILVADDNSPDGTAEEVRKLMKKYKNLNILEGEKKGLGAAYVRGMTYAIETMKADVVFEMDADLSHDPYKIPEFLKKIDEGYDMVIGTRYSDGGSIPSNWGLIRKVYSIFGNLLVRSILMRFAIHDWTGGFRALRKEVFIKEKPKLTVFQGYTFQVSFLHKAVQDKFKIAEVPIHFTDRTLGKSKIAPREYIVNLLKYVFTARFIEILNSPFPKYALTGFIGYAINAIGLELFKKHLGVNSGVAASMGAELSIIWNFTVNNLWTFSSQRITDPLRIIPKFIQFNLVSIGSLIIIGTVVGITTHIFGDTGIVRQVSLVIAIGFFVIPYSYSMYNIFIWKRWKIPFLARIQKITG